MTEWVVAPSHITTSVSDVFFQFPTSDCEKKQQVLFNCSKRKKSEGLKADSSFYTGSKTNFHRFFAFKQRFFKEMIGHLGEAAPISTREI